MTAMKHRPQKWFLLKLELQEFFVHRRSLHFVPLAMCGVFLSAWIYPVGSPFVPVVLVVVVGLELQFNNIFYRSPMELDAMSLFPISWREIILIKNVATILLLLMLCVLSSMTFLYFSPERITLSHVTESLMYLSTIVFPLLQFGNTQSVRRPRRESGLQINDFIEAVWTLINVAFLSAPFFIFRDMVGMSELSFVYAALTWFLWYRFSLPRTADRIQQEIATICSTV